MESGKLNKYIELQAPVRSQNAMNEWIDTYTTQIFIWGAIEPLSGNRLFQAQQANSEVQGIIKIRYRRNFTATMRLKLGQRIFKIISIIDPDEQHQELNIYYKEVLD